MRIRFWAVLAAAVLLTTTSFALDYPTKPITLICPWAPGGSSDLTCRMVASLSRKYLGVNMNVVNRLGGNGSVALAEMANRTAADGYTLCLFAPGPFTIMPYVQDVSHSLDDFEFIIGTTSEPLAVIVRSDSDLKNLNDIVERYKRTNEAIVHGQSGSNSATHMYSVMMFRSLSVAEQIVPYRGASEALTALLGGDVEMIIIHPGMVLSALKNNDVRVIAMINNERAPSFPDVPTVEEQGFARIHCETYKGFIVPKGTDPAIVKFLNEKMRELTRDPEYLAFLKNNGLEVSTYMDGDAVVRAIDNDVQKLWPMIEELGLLKKGAVRPAPLNK